jgi:hypothetical protein
MFNCCSLFITLEFFDGDFVLYFALSGEGDDFGDCFVSLFLSGEGDDGNFTDFVLGDCCLQTGRDSSFVPVSNVIFTFQRKEIG